MVKNGNVLAIGINTLRNDPAFVHRNETKSGVHSYHAEIVAMRRVRGSLEGATIYVAREMHGKPSLSRPCNRCYRAIVAAGIKEIIYT